MIHHGIRANGKHSYMDFDLFLRSRQIGVPEKKSVRQSVPYMSGFYDFSAINGEPAWGERPATYSFDVIGSTPEEVETLRDRILAWLCNIHDVDIFDDTMPDFHFHGSYDSCDVEEDESGLAVTLTATFIVGPFKIANAPVVRKLAVGDNIIVNDGQTVYGTASCEGNCTIAMNGTTQPISGTGIALLMPIRRGSQIVTVSGAAATLTYTPEVF